MRVRVVRYDCMGDVLVGTSVLPGLRAKYPGAEILWECHQPFDQMLWGNPYIDQIVYEKPADWDDVNDLTVTLDHDHYWNGAGVTPVKTMAALHCEQAGVPFHSPELYLTADELMWASPFKGCIAVANAAGWKSRTYNQMRAVLSTLLAELRGRRLPLIQIDNGPSLGLLQPFSLSIRRAAAVIAGSRLYLGIDTVFMHMAVALHRPMVLVMGPTGAENQYLGDSAIVFRPKPFTNVFDPDYTQGIDFPPDVVASAVVGRL